MAYQKSFYHNNTIRGFLSGKSETSVFLFEHLMNSFEKIGPIHLHATKSMIVISADSGFAYVVAMGKNFIDVVLPFKELFEDNLCFKKIALVPGTNDYNHHLRIMLPEDLNEEVLDYLKKAYANGKNI